MGGEHLFLVMYKIKKINEILALIRYLSHPPSPTHHYPPQPGQAIHILFYLDFIYGNSMMEIKWFVELSCHCTENATPNHNQDNKLRTIGLVNEAYISLEGAMILIWILTNINPVVSDNIMTFSLGFQKNIIFIELSSPLISDLQMKL